MMEDVNPRMHVSAVILEDGLVIDVRLPTALEVVELELVVPLIIALIQLQDGVERTAKFRCVIHLAFMMETVPVLMPALATKDGLEHSVRLPSVLPRARMVVFAPSLQVPATVSMPLVGMELTVTKPFARPSPAKMVDIALDQKYVTALILDMVVGNVTWKSTSANPWTHWPVTHSLSARTFH